MLWIAKRKVLTWIALSLAILAGTIYVLRQELLRQYLDLPAFETDRQAPTTLRLAVRDGTELATRVFLPEGDGPWPTLLIRDPYSYYSILCGLFARYGYACVHQDVRGRFDSGGSWYPVIHEREDGLDTLQWLLEQPWQNGNIATFGSSYVGLVQWAMIDEMPKEVKTVIADVSHGDWYEIVYRNGHFIQGIMTHWALGLHEADASLEEMAAYHPMTESNSRFLDGGQPWFRDYIQNSSKNGRYWASPPYLVIRDAHKEAHMPVLMSAAWHDFFLRGQLEVFEELPEKDNSILFIRNGSHASSPDESGAGLIGSWIRMSLHWLDRHLRQTDNTTLPQAGYLLQSNADGSVKHHPDWPGHSASRRFYLRQLDRAGACDGGELATEPAPHDEIVTYTYDPANPAPSRGGSYQFGPGVQDQGFEACDRKDVLSFASGNFTESFTILGSVNISLQVASSTPDSAFMVKLQEKLADGRVLNIREDITSISSVVSTTYTGQYQPGAKTNLRFDLTPIQWTVRPGSTLRLDISSSSYPVFNAHPNTTTLWSDIAPTETAIQNIFGGSLSIPVR